MAALQYRAFLSYSHADAAWAKWLHRALENYRIDKDLVGRETELGPVPKTLRPIFRDREDFPAGHSLADQTVKALEASQFLIVICSPNAARSKYVDEEIRRFKALGRAARVIPVIVDGEPGDPQRECFPPAVRFKVGPDAEVTSEREEPLAADARPQGDGKEFAKLKVVAGLLGVPLDEVVRRARRARRRRILFQIGAGVAALLFAAVATLGWSGLDTNYRKFVVADDLNMARDAADLCERASEKMTKTSIPEPRQIRLASECIQTFTEFVKGLPVGIALPDTVVISFERYLPALRTFGAEHKLSPQQAEVLRQAEDLAARLRLPIAEVR